MQIYGDESGHLRSLLNGESEIFVLAIVAGEKHECIRCPKRAVRRTTDLQEAKWNDMSEHEKRRVVDCFSEVKEKLCFCCITLEATDLRALPHSYLLHQNRTFDSQWDLALIALGYSVLLSTVIEKSDADSTFTFDRLFGAKQSNQISRRLDEEHTEIEIRHTTSHGTVGIQAADCVAGAVAETHRQGRNWFGEVNVDITYQTEEFLATIGQRLRDSNKTGP